jgi:uncharacterized protein YjiS (DUF1127 family)
MQLPEPPRLVQPTVAVRDSWLAEERAVCALDGISTELLDRATQDFGQPEGQARGEHRFWISVDGGSSLP